VAEMVLPVPAAVADNPLRRARRRRGFTLAVLADLSGLSVAFLSMVENGQRKLSRRDHINAIAVALGVTPAEIAPGATPGFGEWKSLPAMHLSPFPAISDDFVIGRHRALARQFSLYMGQGDLHAAGVWLRRVARDHSVSPWLLLDQLIMQTGQSGLRARLLGGSGALVSGDHTGRGRAG
jgi:lambda repressor-like predicted transcriptional regulator